MNSVKDYKIFGLDSKNLELELFLAEFLSDIFATKLKVLSTNQRKIWEQGAEFFTFKLGNEDIYLKFSMTEVGFPFEWLLSRFAKVLFDLSNKYNSMKIIEPAINFIPAIASEFTVFNEDLSQKLFTISVFINDTIQLKNIGMKSSYDFHPLEDDFSIDLRISSFIQLKQDNCLPNSLKLDQLSYLELTFAEQIFLPELILAFLRKALLNLFLK